MPFPTSYLAPQAQPVPQPAPGPDATAEFHEALNDPSRWVIKSGVPVFKAHERTDPATGQLIRVDLPKLYRIAANMQRLEREGGVPIRMTLGHTEPGKPETQQPPIGGYYKNARVQPFGPKGEPAVVVDEWLDPQYQGVRKNFPYRSAEYYDDAEQITGVALLTRDPYLDLGVVAYSRQQPGTPLPYMVDETRPKHPTHYSWNGRRPVMYHLVLGEPMVPPNLYPNAGAPQPYQPQPMPQVDAAVAAAGAQQMGGEYPQPQAPTNYGHEVPPTDYAVDSRNVMRGAFQGGMTGARLGPYGAAGGAVLGGLAGAAGFMGGEGQSNPLAGHRGYPVARPAASYAGGSWNGNYHRPPMHRQHPSGGAVYAQTPYVSGSTVGAVGGALAGGGLGAMVGGPAGAAIGAGLGGMAGHTMGQSPKEMIMNSRYSQTPYDHGPMDAAPGGPPPGGPGGGPPEGEMGDPLQQLQMLLMAAVEVLGQMSGGAGPGGPGGPPPGGPGGGPPEGPMPFSRGQQQYADAPRQSNQGRGAQGRPRGGYAPYSNPGDPVNYGYPYGVDQFGRPLPPPARRPAPTPYGALPPGARTISGREPGAAMRESQLQYQLQQQNQAIRILMYKADQADTQACVEAIQRLADAGYQVGEYEIAELKKRREGDERQVFLDTIATKYQKVGTTPLPPLLGDPQPAGPDPSVGAPLSQEEMERALKAMQANPNIGWPEAMQYARGQGPTQYGANRLATGYAGNALGGSLPGFDPNNPYGEPSANGRY